MINTHNLTKENIPKSLLYLATPLILGNILQQFYNTADAFILGHFSGATDFASVGIASSIMNLFLFIIIGGCSGISIIFAQFFGARNYSSFRQEHCISLFIGIIATVIFSLIGFTILPFILKIIKTPVELTPFVQTYLHIILIGLPASFLYNLYGSILRSIGHTNAGLIALIIAVIFNLTFDYIFIVWFCWGISGAAWSTVLSQLVASIICIIYLHHIAPNLFFSFKDCYFDIFLIKKTTYFSLITGLHQSSLYIGKLMVQGIVNTGGTEMISAYTVTSRIEGFANSFGDSGCSATSVLIAQNIGADESKRVQKIFKYSFIFMSLLGIIMGTSMFLSSHISVKLLLGSNDNLALAYATNYMKTISIFYIFCFIGNVFSGYFDGIGHVSISFIGSTFHIGLRVFLSFILIKQMGLSSIALATGIGWLLVNILWAIIKHNVFK